MNNTTDRTASSHGDGYHHDYDQRAARDRSRGPGSRDNFVSCGWDPLDRRLVGGDDRYSGSRRDGSGTEPGRHGEGGRASSPGDISFRQATRGYPSMQTRGRGQDGYDPGSPPYKTEDRCSPVRSRGSTGGRDLYANRSAPRDGDGWMRDAQALRSGGHRGDEHGRQRNTGYSNASSSPDRPRLAGTALAALRVNTDGSLKLPGRHIQRGVVLIYPQSASDPLPAVKPRPDGCLTAFVGGLPPRCREHHVHDVFSECGQIKSLRLKSRTHLCKTFAHVEYADAEAVERAVAMSGWYIKVDRTKQPEAIGRLLVDYSTSSKKPGKDEDTAADAGGKKRSRSPSVSSNAGDIGSSSIPVAKRRRMGRNGSQGDDVTTPRKTLPSPARLDFSESTVADLTEKFENGDRNLEPYLRLSAEWLSRGECTPGSRDLFFALLKAILSSHVRRLSRIIQHTHREVMATQSDQEQHFRAIDRHVRSCNTLVEALHSSNVSDIFTKAQEKTLDLWLENFQDMKKELQEARFMNLMEANEPESVERIDEDSLSPTEHIEYLEMVRDTLLASSKRQGVRMVTIKHQCRALIARKNKEISELHQQLSSSVRKLSRSGLSDEPGVSDNEDDDECGEGEDSAYGRRKSSRKSDSLLLDGECNLNWVEETAFLSDDDEEQKPQLPKKRQAAAEVDTHGESAVEEERLALHPHDLDSISPNLPDYEIADMLILQDAEGEDEDRECVTVDAGPSHQQPLSNEAASVVAVVSSFLMIHPHGATADSINAYLTSIGCSVPTGSVLDILQQLPMVFSCSRNGGGNNEEDCYRMSAFDTICSPLHTA
ncbi:ecto-NOX disulfide-thiol exchanger 1-like [Sycon ciliatum]|uniref:ecto-NOX disulfide-thiol exchanger 1-like n=1 Tax=Sycon ciliatum TaxID=27933 RepID=UPI0031F6471A